MYGVHLDISPTSHLKYKESLVLWRPAILEVLARTGRLPIGRKPYIVAFPQGKNPVFWVDGKYVIKFFSNHFSSEGHWENEIHTLVTLKEKLEIPPDLPLKVPKLLSKGCLYEKGDPWLKGKRWKWPFTIQQFVRGASILNTWSDMNQQQRESVAVYVGRALRVIHELPYYSNAFAEKAKDLDKAWADWDTFLKQQHMKCYKNHKAEKLLNESLLKDLRVFLPHNIASLWFDISQTQPVLLHGDITPENIVDFGDVKRGDPLYDLVAIHLDLFKCDKDLTMKMMTSYGLDTWKRRMMCYTLIHPDDPIKVIWEHKPEWRDTKSLTELQKFVWDFGFEENEQPVQTNPDIPVAVLAPEQQKDDGDK